MTQTPTRRGFMKAGLAAGAGALNDVSGLRFDPRLAEVAAYSGKDEVEFKIEQDGGVRIRIE